jgi:signal transduction histidine kinase
MSSQTNIFISNFTLKFSNSDIESIYNSSNKKHLKRTNIIYYSLFLTISIIIDVLLYYYKYLYDDNYMNMVSYITSAVVALCFIITCIFKNIKLQSFICYVLYIISFTKFILLRYFFGLVLKSDSVLFSFILCLEILIRLTWFQAGCLDFFDGLLCTVVLMVVNYAVFYGNFPRALHWRASLYDAVLLLMITMAYFYVKEKRKSFYLNMVLQSKNEWYDSVLENINSGFIQIEDSRVTYMNQTFKTFFKAVYKFMKDGGLIMQAEDNVLGNFTDCNINSLTVGNILPFIFNEIVTNTKEKLTFNNALKLTAEQSLQNSNNFYFLGRANYLTNNKDNNSHLHFEVYGRRSRENSYEFIFNDISRVKIIEEANAEVKYKSLFLSKVAHEFKNPILCITELIDQIFDEIKNFDHENSDTKAINDLLLQVKSMSDYMIILIKDLDYFSQKQTMSNTHLDICQVNVKDIILFCNDVTLTLIKKMQKQTAIKFLIEEGCGLPTLIKVDEVKLKQILINLLSNSVKYTNYGSITFGISKEEGAIKFSIKDTGKGISDTQKEKLFKPFSRDFSNRSTISAGLGLFIVKELTELIGSNLNYDSKVNEGSEFWFTINQPDDSKANHTIDNIDKEKSYVETQSFNSQPTLVNEFNPILIKNLNINTYNNSERESIGPKKSKYSFTSFDWGSLRATNQVNIILVDDEVLPRQATLRLIRKFFENRNVNVNVLEGNDGIDCLALFYKAVQNKVKIDFILSDETMSLLNGVDCATLLKKIYSDKVIEPIPFFILTAYESIGCFEGVKLTFTKPMNENKLKVIFETINM